MIFSCTFFILAVCWPGAPSTRAINLWNSLDEESVSSVYVNSFKGKLQKLHTRLLKSTWLFGSSQNSREALSGKSWVYFQDTLRYVSAHLWCLRLFMFTKCDYFRLCKTAKMTRKSHNLFVVACLATFCAAANAGDCGLFKFDDGKYVEPFSAPSKVLVWVWSHWHFDSHKAVFVVASHNEVGICVRCVFLCRAVNPYTLLIELL